MPKCPKCGSELMLKDDIFQCPDCGSKFKAQKKPQEQATEAVGETPQPQKEVSESEKIRVLEARLAALEAEKQAKQDKPQTPLKTVFAKDGKLVMFFKKYWLYLLVGVLLFVTFLTLMITLVGLRGIYVNVNNANDFYDFDVTSYRASSIDFLTGKEELEEGKWKLDGNKLTLTIKDEFFGEISDDFDFVQLDGFKRIKIDDGEYKRVSLVGLKTTQKKVKITFDPQNGQAPTVHKIKIGSAFDKEPPEELKNGLEIFSGWYTQPSGQGDRYGIGGTRFWEDVTFYAYWQEPEWIRYVDIDDNGTLKSVKDKSKLPRELEIPNIITRIGSDAFKDCTKLKSITIPDSVTSIGDGAFEGCKSLTKITIPDSVTSIGDGAFSGCTGLQTVYIGEGVTSIGGDAFYETPWYDTLPDGVVYIGKILYKYKGEMPQNTSIDIQDGTVSISPRAFENCKGLQTVTIGDSVQRIGYGTFLYCTGLKTVNWYANNCTYTGYLNDSPIFKGCPIATVNFDDDVQTIPAHAFYDCTRLTEIIIPDSVTSIGSSAFRDCTGLKEITIPDSVTSIGSSAFRDCTGLQTTSINAQNIGSNAFSGCTGLLTVTFGEGVTSIGDSSFYDCTLLKSFDVDINNATYQSKDGILYKKKDKSIYRVPKAIEGAVTILDGCTSIGYGAFRGCTGLSEITIPDSVTSIGQQAFFGCTGLQTVTIGEGVTNIGDSAFYNCTGLKDIYYAGNETQWENIEKDMGWDEYFYYSGDKTINYQLHYNSTGPSAASAEIAEENAGNSAAFEEGRTPVVWVKKQRLCA